MTESSPSPLKLVMTLLVRNEIDIVSNNIDFHLGSGVDHIIAIDNGSEDGTREILTEYERGGQVTVIDEPGRNYAQRDWVTRAALMARDDLGADWIINVDADEFWWCPGLDIKARLVGQPASKLFCRHHNMVYAFDEEGEGVWRDRIVHRIIEPVELPAPNNIYYGRLAVPLLYVELGPKAILRAEGLCSIWQGNHDADYAEKVESASLDDLLIYHFPVRSARQFEQKVRQGGEAYARNSELGVRLGWHWRRWFRMLQEAGIKRALWDALPRAEALEADLRSGRVAVDHTICHELKRIAACRPSALRADAP